MQQRGWQKVERGKAALWISYFATSERQQDVRTYQRYNSFYGYARCYRCYYPVAATTEVQVVDYTEATLMVDVIDPASNTLKWRGSTSNKVTTSWADSMTVAERTERVNQAIAAILRQYPPNVPPRSRRRPLLSPLPFPFLKRSVDLSGFVLKIRGPF